MKTEGKNDLKTRKTHENEGEKQIPLIISRNLIKPAESAPTSHINQAPTKMSNPFMKPSATFNNETSVPHNVTTTNAMSHTTTTSSGGNGNI